MPLLQELRLLSRRLAFSYVLDCIVLILFAGLAAACTFIEPSKREFSLTDASISFPYRKDTVSIGVAFIACVIAPAGVIFVICLSFVSVPLHNGPASRAFLWRRKLWELFTGLLGLALSVVGGFFFTQTMKNLFGKHRPDFLARCNPDLSQLTKYSVGGFSDESLEGSSVIVNWGICRGETGSGVGLSEYNDGFRSFPSGHCTIAFAGLVYLSLFLASKFSVFIPFLAPSPYRSPKDMGRARRFDRPGSRSQRSWSASTAAERYTEPRDQSAAPPIHLLIIVLIPFGAAIYIAATRFTDHKHHGFDVFFSSVEGMLFAWFGFRWYHMPVSRGAGWSWGPRGKRRAFGIRTGTGSYADPSESDKQSGPTATDLEAGRSAGVMDESMELQTYQTGTADGSNGSQRQLV